MAGIFGNRFCPLASVAETQQPNKVYSIGYLSVPTTARERDRIVAFKQGPRALGYLGRAKRGRESFRDVLLSKYFEPSTADASSVQVHALAALLRPTDRAAWDRRLVGFE